MADLFKCDKCGQTLAMACKKGRLVLQELTESGMPHAGLYNSKAEVCPACFDALKRSMNQTVRQADVAQSLLLIGQIGTLDRK